MPGRHTIYDDDGRPIVGFLTPRAAFVGRDTLRDLHRRMREAGVEEEIVEQYYGLCELARAYAEPRVAPPSASDDVPGGIPVRDVSARLTCMSAKATAERIGCTPRNVRALAERNVLLGVKDGRGRWRFDRDDVDAFLEERSA